MYIQKSADNNYQKETSHNNFCVKDMHPKSQTLWGAYLFKKKGEEEPMENC